ncbi:cytochrome P450 302a1, mitochondrial [Periplaneta americana]|uniref:cytochrome P450 302a1, mitochondrial n=1 Tax=Periplaneta americana TaxID=6978 RepID=UPI0037E8ADF9
MWWYRRGKVAHLHRMCKYTQKARLLADDVTTDISRNHDTLQIRPFNEIPGPKSLPVVGTLWKYLPIFGEYSFKKLHVNGYRKLMQYGPLVREEIVPGVNIVWVFTPSDIEQVFRHEGRYPERRSHLALQKYRQDRPNVYNTGGLLPTNGPEWWRLRSEFQRGLSRPQKVKSYLPQTDQIIQEFVDQLEDRQCQDFLPELSRLFLELSGLVAFDIRLGSLSEEEHKKGSYTSRIMEAALTTNSSILATDNGPQLWRYVDTRLYRRLKRAQEFMEKIAVELVQKKVESMSRTAPSMHESQSLLEQYLSSKSLDEKDVTGMAVDMLLAGIDTTTNSSSFALYHLATNADSQAKLHEEACRLLPDIRSPVTKDVLAQAQYTKAVLKESFRLNPISVGIGRILAQDAVLSGYFVPKGTVVVTQNQVTCRLEEHFTDASRFMPERWIKGHPLYTPVSPYLVLPFGHGPRTCIARWLAEQNLHTLLLKMIRRYKIGWAGGDLDCISLLINKPDRPIQLTLKEWSK